MKLIMKAFTSRKKGIGSQRGFTLTEIIIVLIISALLLVGSSQMVYHMVVTSTKDRAKADALCQVQYVGFWISEDVMQARPEGVILSGGNETDPSVLHFPITIEWTQWNGVEHEVVYSIEYYENWTLSRDVTKGSSSDLGKTVVGEFLDLAGTKCYWDISGNATDVLKLEVAANVDGQVASRTYEINPRSK